MICMSKETKFGLIGVIYFVELLIGNDFITLRNVMSIYLSIIYPSIHIYPPI